MKSQINLISRKTEQHGIGRFNIIALSIFAGIFVIAIACLVYTFILNLQVSSLEATKNDLETQIGKLSSEKLNVLLLKERLTSIDKVLHGRIDLNPKMQIVLSLLPDTVQIGSIETDSRHIAVTVQSPRLSDLNTVLEERLTNFTKKPGLQIGKIDLDSAGLDTTTGRYYAILNLQYGVTAQ
jgi:hypothetical protein